jgi:hypothetical protein
LRSIGAELLHSWRTFFIFDEAAHGGSGCWRSHKGESLGMVVGLKAKSCQGVD